MKISSRTGWWITVISFGILMFYLAPPVTNTPMSTSIGIPDVEPYRYRAVILVLASHQSQLYRNCRRVWLQYATREPTIRVFFVYGRDSLPYNERTIHDLVYEDIPETYNPGMILKTQRAVQEINALVSYDFFVRTNLSTFWDLEALLEHLRELPDHLCYSGHGPHGGGTYLSGTDTIVNEYMARQFGEYGQLDLNVPEDQAMGFFFHGYLGAPFLPSRIYFIENYVNEAEIRGAVIRGKMNRADHYRVKHEVSAERERVDLMAYKILLETIYQIELK